MITDTQLNRWIHLQRTNYRNGILPQEKIKILESFPGWTWDPLTDAWEDGIIRLKEYVEKHGEIPAVHYRNKDGFRLGQWTAVQRMKCKIPERRKRLEQIPGWFWNKIERAWEKGFQELKKHGVENVTISFVTPEGYKLGVWTNAQRQRCTDPEKRKRLESLPNWSWDPISAAWEIGFDQLKKYGMSNRGRENITPDGYPLGRWIAAQRENCSDPKRRKRLESIPGWAWNVNEELWNRGLTQFKKHGKKDTRLDFITKDGYKLGEWIGRQRAKCKNVKRRKILSSLPNWTWEIGVGGYVRAKKRH